jgi:RsiW-degrading membrane proteinase PrsW (M82 family)
MDRYEREPLWLLGVTFGYGAIIGILGAVLGSTLIVNVFGIDDFTTQAVVVAPFIEEPAKAFILLMLLLTFHFDNATDGLVYGAATGLGFAMTENFLYFAQYQGGTQEWIELVATRSLFTAVLHASASAIVGVMLGLFRYRGKLKQWLLAPTLGLTGAIALHSAFNASVVRGELGGEPSYTVLAYTMVALMGVLLFGATQVSLHFEHKMLARELADEAEEGHIPAEHAAILPFYRRRRGVAWLAGYPELVQSRASRRKYVRKATLLAFRKHQAKSPGPIPSGITADIKRLRKDLRGMLEKKVVSVPESA